jgi:hypothetical protein
MDRECSMHDTNGYEGLVVKPEKKRPLGVPNFR